MKYGLFATAVCMVCIVTPTLAQKGIPAKNVVHLTHTTNYPQIEEFSPALISRLKVAAGWKISVAAKGLGKPRMLYAMNDSMLYVTRRDAGDVLLLKDQDGDGIFDDMTAVVAEFKGVHGITVHNGWMYLASNHDLKRYPMNADGTVGDMQPLINNMPDGGQHGNRTLAFGPDGMLYITIGSLCNDCASSDKFVASVVQVDTVTWKPVLFASGLRNTIGFDFDPQTGEMWGADNGGDTKGDDWPPEELNHITKGSDYGWPYAYGKREIDETREDPPGSSKAIYVSNSQPSVMEFTAHMAPTAFQFFGKGTSVPRSYENAALICWHGSWDRSEPAGYKITLVRFTNGQPTASEDFVSGFLNSQNRTRFGRPTGLAITKTGTIFFSDDANGIIYAVRQTK